MSRLRVRDAQRRVADAERFVNVVREPRLVPELPGTPQVRGKLREQIVQAVQVLFEIGRQLGFANLGRVKRALPLGEVVARGADADVHATHTVLMFTNSRSPYADSSRP